MLYYYGAIKHGLILSDYIEEVIMSLSSTMTLQYMTGPLQAA
jgi:hypothetical protein